MTAPGPPHAAVTRSLFDRFAAATTRGAGSSYAFVVAALCIIVWALTGPLFHFSERWLLAVNTGSTIVTFLMVFLIQQSQNKHSAAIHIKLDELLVSHETASNRLVAAEHLDEAQLVELRKAIPHLARAEVAEPDQLETPPATPPTIET
jgi:low affinity Fe/Cu permease